MTKKEPSGHDTRHKGKKAVPSEGHEARHNPTNMSEDENKNVPAEEVESAPEAEGTQQAPEEEAKPESEEESE